ncbi:MAG TPA: arginine--tRNA ligase [Nocardioides sp.]|uniref:arginine--tRNA ligase n=1 Tax=uncultured Nocardioides sp. TaxID=198441 RepID=UPI000EBD924A|nr:arginine--tRNA ligase [uncultured Nocardioides sp.]HCB05212.1 arginine--tRNA ligase [Nocardioides sp.]HRD59690.1 arginine--tRNA ligase [Nocardioides sp.]HRI96883.1 arginine--tRNA ligase [Nocardioides sp.]HRK45219.1 arginine--tRNA ligase [Nocardioides sp.]
MTPEQLSAAIVEVLTALSEEGALALPDGVPSAVTVERPRQKEHGDYATNVALQLAKKAGQNPRDLAGRIQDRLVKIEGIAAVDIAGPGFLNISVEAGAQGVVAEQIVAAGRSYGRSTQPYGGKVNVEFISANPTGPLHLGHTRWAVVGDALARVLEAAGAEVAREFYINDRGRQMDLFGESLAAAALGQPVPDDGYHGAYIADLARQVIADDPGVAGMEAFREAGYALQLKEQRDELTRFNTVFDVWFSERDLHRGDVAAQLEKLRELGHLYDADGALWMRTTDFGDDKDRVLIRSNGELTYFASDTAYYVNKRSRGFDTCIYLLGADHHGYVGRLKAMAACVGDDPEKNIEVLIGQLVKIMRGSEEVRLSKRAGDLVTLQELMDEIGVDPLRYSLARYPQDSPLTLDIEQITRASNDNPVYYVQYVAARTASLLRNAHDLGLNPESHPELLSHEKEGELLRALADYPRVVQGAADLREPHRIPRYLEETAATFHRFYDGCRVLPKGDEEPTDLHRARLLLVQATRTVFENGLDLVGVTAPERM